MSDENQDQPKSSTHYLSGDPISNLGAVVLCGGKSSRLGIDKTQLDFRGRTFLEQVVHQVRQVCSQVVVVGNADLDFHSLPADVLVARDQALGKGPLEGIRVGLERLALESAGGTAADGAEACEFAFVTSCDVPLLKPELIRFLFEKLESRRAIVPVQGDRVFGMTAIYRTEFHVEIGKRVESDKLRVSDLATAFDAIGLDADSLRQIDPDLDSLTNINSVEDYRKLLDRLGLQCPADLAKAIGL